MVTALQRRCRIEGTAIVMAAAAASTSTVASPPSPRDHYQPYSLTNRGNLRSRRVEAGLAARPSRKTKGKRHAAISLSHTNGAPINFETIATAAAAQALRREAYTLLATYTKEDKENNDIVDTNTWRNFVPLPDGGRKRRLILQAMHACCARVMGQADTARASSTTSDATATAYSGKTANGHNAQSNTPTITINNTTTTANEVVALDTFLLVRGPPKLTGDDNNAEQVCIQLDAAHSKVSNVECTSLIHNPYTNTTSEDSDDDDIIEEDEDIEIVEDMATNTYGANCQSSSLRSISLPSISNQAYYSDDDNDNIDDEDDDEDYCLARQVPRTASTLSIPSVAAGPSWTSSCQLNSSQQSNKASLVRAATLRLADARRDMAMVCGATRTWQARQAYAILAARTRYNTAAKAQSNMVSMPPRDPFGFCPPSDDATRLRKIAQQRAYTVCMDAPASRTRRGRESPNRWLTTAVETYMTRIGKITGPLHPRAFIHARADTWTGSPAASPLSQVWSADELAPANEMSNNDYYTDVPLDFLTTSMNDNDDDADYREAYLLNAAAAVSAMESNLMPLSAAAMSAEFVDVEAAFAEMDQLVSPMDIDTMDEDVPKLNEQSTALDPVSSLSNDNSVMIAIAG